MRRQRLRADEARWRAVEEMAAGLKKLPRELLVRLKELLVLYWRKKSGARLRRKLAIEEALDVVRALARELSGAEGRAICRGGLT